MKKDHGKISGIKLAAANGQVDSRSPQTENNRQDIGNAFGRNVVREEALKAPGFFNRQDIFWAGLVFFASYFFYLISLFPTVTSEDSGEFTAAAYSLGVAHPPGYPLFVILGKIFTVLLPFGDIAWRVNVLSAFFGAATIAAIYLLARLLSKDPAIGVITALFFAGGEIFWSQAVRAEVYTLNTFFLVLVILLAVLWHFMETSPLNSGTAPVNRQTFDVRRSSKVIYWLAFIYGLSIGNHQMMLLAGPPLLIFVLIAKPRIFLDLKFVAKAALFFIIGLSVYLFLPLAASYKPAVNWGNPVTWDNFWTLVTRKIYSADSINMEGQLVSFNKPGVVQSEYSTPMFTFLRLHVWEFTRRFFVILDGNYSWIVGLMGILGGIFLWVRSKAVFWLLIMLVIMNACVMSAVTGVGKLDKLPSVYFTDRPFFIPLLLLFVLLGGLGIRYITSLLYTAGKRTAPASKRPLAIVFVALIFVVILAFRFPSQNQSGNYIVNDIARATLDLLPQNAVLHSVNGDNTVFPILYLQTVEKYRPDVKIYMDMPYSIYPYFISMEETEYENPGKRIFTDFPFGYDPAREFVYMGPVAEIVPAGTATAESNTDNKRHLPLPEEIRGLDMTSLDFFHLYIKARFYMDSALTMADDPAKQKQMFESAFTIAPLSHYMTGKLIGNYYLMQKKFAEAIPFLKSARVFLPNEYPINFQLALSLIITGDFSSADTLISGLNMADRELLRKEMGIYANQLGPEYPAIATYLKGKQ